jgi:two-component system sensor histidine kinase PhoQ
MLSIHLRLLLAASLVLAAFFGLGALALDQAFRDSAESGSRERLQAHVYGMLAAAEESESGGMRLPEALPEPKLSTPDSGLYASVRGEQGRYRWHSASLIGRGFRFHESLKPGDINFSRRLVDGSELFVLSFGVAWEDYGGNELLYTLTVAESAANVDSQVSVFRRTLMLWLGGAALLLLMVQGAVLRWGLKPMREVVQDLGQIESGERELLQGGYPAELRGLTSSINSLIRSGRASRDRYRNSLGDLAHSLKTPLAVLQSAADGSGDDDLRGAVKEQVPRMNDIVQYQLKRAAASADPGFSRRVSVEPVIVRLLNTLHKVYTEKGVQCELSMEPGVSFSGDEGDLLELSGNLLENAFKYCHGQVRIAASVAEVEGDSQLHLVIEDDGPGIPVEMREKVRGRGIRADQRSPGQGIGMSVADEIIRLYKGRFSIGDSALGGARLEVDLPAA